MSEATEADVFIDDVKLQDLGIEVKLSSNEPMLPPFDDNSIRIAGRAGAYPFPSKPGPRPFELDCMWRRVDITGQKYTDLKIRIREFVVLFVDAYGQPKKVKLRSGDEPDKFYTVKVVGGIPLDRLAGMPAFTIPLLAHDPYAKFYLPSDAIIMDSDIPIMSDLLWDTGLSNRVITASETFTVINNGTIALVFSFKVEGSGTNVAFTANGKTMTFGTFTNKTFDINGENYTVKVDGVSDLEVTNAVFLELLPGINEISVTGSNLNLTVSESLTYKYL